MYERVVLDDVHSPTRCIQSAPSRSRRPLVGVSHTGEKYSGATQPDTRKDARPVGVQKQDNSWRFKAKKIVPLSKEQQSLVVSHLHLLNGHSEDMWSAGVVGLCDAASMYRPSRGHFAQLARIRIRGEQIDFKHPKRKMHYRGSPAVSFVPLPEISRGDDPDRKVEGYKMPSCKEDASLKIDVDDALSSVLSSEEQRLVWLRFSENLTCKEIGEVIGKSESWVSHLLKDVTTRAQDILAKRGLKPSATKRQMSKKYRTKHSSALPDRWIPRTLRIPVSQWKHRL